MSDAQRECSAAQVRCPLQPKLDGLSVHIFSVSDLEDGNLVALVVYEVDDSVLALPHAVAVGVSRELF